MAGFRFFNRTSKEVPFSTPPAPPIEAEEGYWEEFEQILPEGVSIICKEDIYFNKDGHYVLLIKAGQAIEERLIPKLIKFGVQPHQFELEVPPVEEEELPETKAMTPPSLSKIFRSPNREKILLMDPDEKSQKRLTDCLVACGVSLNNIHPVLVLDNLPWALNKYTPKILFLDFNLDPKRAGLGTLLKSLQNYPFLKHIIVTIPLPPEKEKLRKQLTELARNHGAHVIFKPVNRFILGNLIRSILS
jgi:hypothetical protein